MPEGKFCKDDRHRHEGKARPRRRIQIKGKNGRQDHEAAQNGGEGGEESDPAAPREEVGVFGEVAAVGEHAAATHAEAEEREPHGGQKTLPRKGFGFPGKKIRNPFFCPGERQAAHDENEYQDEKERHQNFVEAFNPLGDVKKHDPCGEKKKGRLVSDGDVGVAHQGAEVGVEFGNVGNDAVP